MSRQEAILEKRAKLELLRRQRQSRQDTSQVKDTKTQPDTVTPIHTSDIQIDKSVPHGKITYDKGTQTVDLEPEEPQLKESPKAPAPVIEDPVIDETKLAKFIATSYKLIEETLIESDPISITEPSLTPITYRNTFQYSPNPITSIDLSPFNNNLIAISYSQPNTSTVLVINIKSLKIDYKFQSYSQILQIKFSLHNKDIIFASCYNGKILQFDLNSDTQYPIAQSPINLQTHSLPVYNFLQINNINENHVGNLISCSTDGKICQWNPFLLDKPVSTIEISQDTTITSLVKLKNNSLIFVGEFIWKLNNLQNLKFIKIKSEEFIVNVSSFNDKYICCSTDTIYLYENDELIRTFKTNSTTIIIDSIWINETRFIIATGTTLELFDLEIDSKFPYYHIDTGEYINKVTHINGSILLGTIKGNLIFYKLN